MRKLLSVVFVLALAFSAANAQLGDGVKIYGDGQIYLYGGYQDASNPEGVAFRKESQFEFVGNLFVSKKFEATGGTGVLHLRGSSRDTNAPDTIWDIGNIRGTINDSFDANNGQSTIYIKELYYTQPVADNFVVFTVGKIPYLGNTQGYGAIGSAFNDDALLATSLYKGGYTKTDGANRDTIKFDINIIPQLTLSYGYSDGVAPAGDKNPTGFGRNGYHAIQLNVKAVEKTNLRFGYGTNVTQAPTFDKGSYSGEPSAASAFWFNGDTGIVDNFTIFAKFSMRLDDSALGAVSSNLPPVGMAFQVGGKIGGALWGRNADAAFVGFAGSSFKTYSDYDEVTVIKNEAGDTEKVKIPMEIHVELNYAYSLDGGLVLTPFIQYVTGIYANQSVKGSGVAGGVKLGFAF